MEISPQTTTIGFIGTGVMGASMAGHILRAGYRVHVYSRTKSRTDDLCQSGAVWEDSVRDVAEKCRLIITMVGFPSDVKEVYFGENGILNHAQKNSMVIDMTTSSPQLAAEIYEQGKKSSVAALDAPVSGGDTGARKAALSIMVGGDKQDFETALPVFKLMGKNIQYQGPAGSGQHTKIANQIAIAAGMIGVCESLAYARQAGLDPENVLKSIGQGAAGSWSLNNLGPRMIAGDYEPGFYIKHFIKDLVIASDSAGALNLDTPGLNLAKSLYEKLAARNCENEGTQALFKLFKETSQC